MFILLLEKTELTDDEVWKSIFAFLYDVWMLILDLIWTTKIPRTNITLAYWIIFWMVVRLSVYAINGTSTDYNELGSSVSSSYRSASRLGIKAFSKTKKSFVRKQATKQANIQKQKTTNQQVKQQYLKGVKNRVNAINKKQTIRGKHNG